MLMLRARPAAYAAMRYAVPRCHELPCLDIFLLMILFVDTLMPLSSAPLMLMLRQRHATRASALFLSNYAIADIAVSFRR